MCECKAVFVKCGNVILRIADISMVHLQDDVIEVTDGNGVLQSVLFTSKRSAKKAFNELSEQLGI